MPTTYLILSYTEACGPKALNTHIFEFHVFLDAIPLALTPVHSLVCELQFHVFNRPHPIGVGR